jgi:hypothetical protein
MKPPIQRSAAYYDHRHRRIMRTALAVSVLLHVVVLFVFRSPILVPESPFAAAGPRSGDDQAAPGGGTEIVNLMTPPPRAAPEIAMPLPIPVPTDRIVPEPEIKIEDPQPQLTVSSVIGEGVTSAAQGLGAGVGAGIEGGTGRGDGGTGESGRFRLLPPSPRGLILPPSDRPGNVKGKEIDVWVFVTEKGTVVADSTRLNPSTGDHGFDDRLKKQAAEWVFDPARRGGRVIAEWFRYTIVL